MKQNATTALLAVIAVLLAANLATSNDRPAEAAAPVQTEEPYVVQITGTHADSAFSPVW